MAAVEALHTIGVGYAQGFVIAKPESLWHLAANVGPEADGSSGSLGSSA